MRFPREPIEGHLQLDMEFPLSNPNLWRNCLKLRSRKTQFPIEGGVRVRVVGGCGRGWAVGVEGILKSKCSYLMHY